MTKCFIGKCIRTPNSQKISFEILNALNDPNSIFKKTCCFFLVCVTEEREWRRHDSIADDRPDLLPLPLPLLRPRVHPDLPHPPQVQLHLHGPGEKNILSVLWNCYLLRFTFSWNLNIFWIKNIWNHIVSDSTTPYF